MLELFTLPTIGSPVSKGLGAIKVPDGEKGAGFVSARNGAVPVAVGPVEGQKGLVERKKLYTSKDFRRDLEEIR